MSGEEYYSLEFSDYDLNYGADAGDRIAYAITVVLGMSRQIAREAILLAALPAGFLGIVFGSKYGVRFQAIGSTLTLSYLASVITLTAAILLT